MVAAVHNLTSPLASAFWNAEGMWIVLTAAATNSACALVGCFLVLRRLSLMGDALSHAVLPGLAAAFILSGSYSIGPLMVGAIIAGLVAAVLTQTLHYCARVPGDASMGVVFTSMFALGVVMIHKGIHGVHFDVKCVYEGTLELSPLYTWSIAGREIPQDLAVTGAALAVNALVITLLWKELTLSAFDPALATTMGFSAIGLHYMLMTLVALTSVAAFKVVGSILVVAMLIVPPATAHLLFDRMGPMVLGSVVIACLSAAAGYAGGVWLDANIAGMMTVAAALFYVMAVLFSPHHGLVSVAIHNLQTSLRVVREDLLGMLYRVEELGAQRRLSPKEAIDAAGGRYKAWWSLQTLERMGLVKKSGDRLELTDSGRQESKQLVRSHRLWETFLVKYLGLPLDHVHEPAHRVEHFIDDQMRERLKENLEVAETDPHGRQIPGSATSY